MSRYLYGLLAAAALVVIIWFVFIAPAERRMHERRMELMKRRLKQNEQRISQMQDDDPNPAAESED